jgi:acetoin utilization protein AcuB
MNVADMMTTNPVVIGPDKSLKDALDTMKEVGCHHLPVISEGHLVGIITDHDCRIALHAPMIPPQTGTFEEAARKIVVRQLMTPAPIIAEPDASADEACRLMLAHHVSSMPVMRGETLVGIITTSDILMAFIRMHQREGSMSERESR